MELKKNPAVDGQKVRGPLLTLGLLIIGSLVLASFSYRAPAELAESTERTKDSDDIPTENIVKDVPPPVENTPPPPPMAAPPPITEDTKTKENEDKDPVPDIPPPPPPVIKKDQPKAEAPILDYPDEEAEFPGGAAALKKFLAENINYPEMAIEMGDQGKVFVEFVVNADGSIQNVKVIRNVSKEIDREAIRVVKSMPKWTPAQAGGENARARCRIPINFVIR